MVSLQRHVHFDDKTAWRLFSTLRAEKFRTSLRSWLNPRNIGDLKPEVVWNTEQGMVEGHDVTEALKESERFLADIESLFETTSICYLFPQHRVCPLM